MRDSAGGADEEGEGDAEEGEGASCDAAEEVQGVGEESGVMCLLEKLSVAGRVGICGMVWWSTNRCKYGTEMTLFRLGDLWDFSTINAKEMDQ